MLSALLRALKDNQAPRDSLLIVCKVSGQVEPQKIACEDFFTRVDPSNSIHPTRFYPVNPIQGKWTTSEASSSTYTAPSYSQTT